MREEVYLAFFALAVAAVAVEAWRRYSAPTSRLLRRFRAAPTTPIDRCAEGAMARIGGVAEAVDGTLRAPVSGADRVAFKVVVVRAGLGDQSEPSTVLFEHDEAAVFTLRDASARAYVHPGTRATLVVGDARVLRCTFGDAPEAVRALMARYRDDRAEVDLATGHAESLVEPRAPRADAVRGLTPAPDRRDASSESPLPRGGWCCRPAMSAYQTGPSAHDAQSPRRWFRAIAAIALFYAVTQITAPTTPTSRDIAVRRAPGSRRRQPSAPRDMEWRDDR